MKTYFSAERVIDAPADVVYRCLACYIQGIRTNSSGWRSTLSPRRLRCCGTDCAHSRTMGCRGRTEPTLLECLGESVIEPVARQSTGPMATDHYHMEVWSAI